MLGRSSLAKRSSKAQNQETQGKYQSPPGSVQLDHGILGLRNPRTSSYALPTNCRPQHFEPLTNPLQTLGLRTRAEREVFREGRGQ